MTINGTPQPFAGVVTVPSESVHQSIKAQVDDTLRGVKEGRTMAILALRTDKGVNLAVAHKFTDHFEVVTWVGKSGWDKPLANVEGAVAFVYSK